MRLHNHKMLPQLTKRAYNRNSFALRTICALYSIPFSVLLFAELHYGVVTNHVVAQAINLPEASSIVMYSRTHGIHQYKGHSSILNWTINTELYTS